MTRCSWTTSCPSVSAAVLYVGGRPVAETEHVGVDVVVLHPAGQTQDADRRRPAAGQDSRHDHTWREAQPLMAAIFILWVEYKHNSFPNIECWNSEFINNPSTTKTRLSFMKN